MRRMYRLNDKNQRRKEGEGRSRDEKED